MAKGWWGWEQREFMQNLCSGPLGEQAKLGFISLSVPSSLQEPTLSPLVTQKILHLGNCPSTAEK